MLIYPISPWFNTFQCIDFSNLLLFYWDIINIARKYYERDSPNCIKSRNIHKCFKLLCNMSNLKLMLNRIEFVHSCSYINSYLIGKVTLFKELMQVIHDFLVKYIHELNTIFTETLHLNNIMSDQHLQSSFNFLFNIYQEMLFFKITKLSLEIEMLCSPHLVISHKNCKFSRSA